ncbi:MAG: topoisomerase, partial [Chthonomonadales bacterium]|nr:topoisomerase [Chthonomonadales bacterium]
DSDPKKTPGYRYAPETPKQFKTKSSAQDAHEAIRPTSVYHEPDQIARFLSSDQARLYRIIWQRFVASQMMPAVMDVTTADIAASQGNVVGAPYLFRSTGSVVKFDGFMRVYTEGKDTEELADDEQPPLPPLAKDQPLDLLGLEPKQHFTEPPPRYTEATIVKALDEQGIGRPSTWASIIQTIRDREYVELTEKRFYPTELGFKVNDSLVKHFPSVMDLKFTADMETKLDEVAEGKSDWVNLLHEFYNPFALQLTAAATEMESLKAAPVETEFHCPDTGAVMLLRQSRYGAFLGCSDYPKCKKILKLDENGQPAEGLDFLCGLLPQPEKPPVDPTTLPGATEHVCPLGKGVMIQRIGRRGPFLGCSSYPKCHTLLNINPDGSLKEGQEFNCTYSDTPVKSTKKTTARKTTAKAGTTKRAATTAAKAPARRTGSTGTKGE